MGRFDFAQRGAYPPALPTLRQAQGKHGKGACCVMVLVVFHSEMAFFGFHLCAIL